MSSNLLEVATTLARAKLCLFPDSLDRSNGGPLALPDPCYLLRHQYAGTLARAFFGAS